MKKIKKVLIVGHKGFIGSNLFEYFKQQKKYAVTGIDYGNSIKSIHATEFDYTVFAAGNSKTYLIKKDPIFCIEKDFTDLLKIIRNVHSKKFILLSSCLVYDPELKIQSENSSLDVNSIPLYGVHKLLMEKYVKEFCSKWLILRPTGFFGKHLKKNLLFDLKNGKREIFYHKDSTFDFLHIRDFCRILDKLKDADNEIFNVGAGVTFSVNEILSMKKNKKFTFVGAHKVRNSNVSIKKIKKITRLRFNHNKLYEEIYNFINNLEKT